MYSSGKNRPGECAAQFGRAETADWSEWAAAGEEPVCGGESRGRHRKRGTDPLRQCWRQIFLHSLLNKFIPVLPLCAANYLGILPKKVQIFAK